MVKKIFEELSKGVTIWQRVERLENMVETMDEFIQDQQKRIEKQENYLLSVVSVQELLGSKILIKGKC